MDKVILVSLALSFLGAAIAETAPDCNAGLENLLQHVNKPNVTKQDCSNARNSIQTLLKTCDSSDPAEYVSLTMDFVRHFAEDGVCEGTEGPVSVCHEVPKCYNFVIGDDNNYSCGKDNVNAKNSLECFQEQIDAGCVEIGTKIKGFSEVAAEEYCDYEMSSSADRFVLSVVVLAASVMTAFV